MARTTSGRRQIVRNFVTCLKFNGSGSSGVVNVTHNSSLGSTNTALTLAAWIRPMSMGSSSAGRIIDKITTTNGYQLLCGSGNIVSCTVDGTSLTGNAGMITLGVWQHIAYTLDGSLGSNQSALYVNGILIKNGTRAGTFTVDSTTLRIGNRGDGIRCFDGFMDDVRVYMDRALTATELLGLTYGQEPSTTGLVLHHKYDEGSGTSATDSSGNSNTGTISSATYSTSVFIKPRTTAGARITAGTRTAA